MQYKVDEIMAQLEALRNTKNVEGMERYGIVTKGKAFGVATPELNKIAKVHKNDQDLAVALWNAGYHETRKLATLIADKKRFTPELMDKWTSEFYSWDICDSACFHTFRYLPFAVKKIFLYAAAEEEFTRRTAFSLIAGLAIVNKKSPDDLFLAYFPLIEKYAGDERNFVKKAVNWALRQTGKRSRGLYAHAVQLAEKLAASDNKTTAWIGKDALKEFQNPKIVQWIKK